MVDQAPFKQSSLEASQGHLNIHTQPLTPQSTANQWSQIPASLLIAGPPSQSQPHASESTTNQPSQAFLLTQQNQIIASSSTAGRPNQCQISNPSQLLSQNGSVEKPKIEQTMSSGDKVCSTHSKTPFSSVTY